MEEKICPACGSNLKAGANFCSACGHRLPVSKSSKVGSRRFPRRDSTVILVVLAISAVVFLIYTVLDMYIGRASGSPNPSAPPYDESAHEEIISGLPKEYDKLVETGNMFMDNRNYPMAVICYRKAVELDDSDPGVLVDLGVCLHAVGNSDEAIHIIERAIALDSTHMIAHFNMGVIYRDLNNPDKGKLYWEELIRLYPETPLADTVRKYLNSPGI